MRKGRKKEIGKEKKKIPKRKKKIEEIKGRAGSEIPAASSKTDFKIPNTHPRGKKKKRKRKEKEFK